MENNLDKLFKSKLGNLEPEFHPAAWDRMEGLLDESGMSPVHEKKPKWSRKIYLFFLMFGILFSVVGYYSIESSITNGEGRTLVDSGKSDLEKDQLLLSNENSTTPPPTTNIASPSDNSNEKLDQKNISSTRESSIQEVITSQSQGQEIKQEIKQNTKLGAEHIEYNTNDTKSTNLTKSTTESKLFTPIAGSINNRDNVISEQEVGIQNDWTGSESLTENLKSENPSDNNSNRIAENKLQPLFLGKDENSNTELLDQTPKAILSELSPLQTSTSLLSPLDKLISPQIEILKPSVFEFGIQASIRPGSGLGYSFGPYLAYSLGQGFKINVGGQFDSQNFDSGPQLKVYDKVYGFGSEIFEREFALSNQKSLRIPLTLSRSFGSYSISTGLMINKVFASGGSISNNQEGVLENNVVVDNEMIQTMTISYQLSGSISFGRHLEFDLGMEYRPKAFVTDPTTSNDASKYYPTLGLRYKLFKF